MSIEAGARAGLIAPDDTTFEYVQGRRHAPQGAAWDAALERWRRLPTDDGATYDASITLAAGDLEPMDTYGTNPGMGIPITGRVPSPEEADASARRGLSAPQGGPGPDNLSQPSRRRVHRLRTNSRISDLRLPPSARATTCRWTS
jgi:3-isopropylmalate/(R)-2-methylmalate dehydratase large subunit